ncbi:MAG: zinc-ribbon domain-containing protein [Actinomycetota bacterium]
MGRPSRFVSDFPELLAAWDSQRNASLPSEVSTNSATAYWWSCPVCGYGFQSKVRARLYAKEPCPACALAKRDAKKRERVGSLASAFPKVAAEWHPDRNPGLSPDVLAPGSSKSVWWRCASCGIEWRARIGHRTGVGAGCPSCGRAKARDSRRQGFLTERGSLADAFPGIAAQWHPTRNGNLTPDQVLPFAATPAWWQCSRGHHWQTAIYNRTIGKTKCPFCNAQTSEIELRLFTELDGLFGNAVWRADVEGVEVDVWLPDRGLGIEIDGYPWHEGKERQDAEKTRKLEAAGHRLLHLRHELLVPLSDADVRFGSRTPHRDLIVMALRRAEALDWLPAGSAERYETAGGFVNGARFDEMMSWLPGPMPGNSLADTHPDVAAQWHHERNLPLTPSGITAGSSRKVWWRCPNGHEWSAVIVNRAKGAGCAMCSKKAASAEHNLVAADPETMRFWDAEKNDADPACLTPRSNRVVWWRCASGHSFDMSVKDFARRRSCPYCAGKRVGAGNSVLAALPALAALWDHERNGSIGPGDVARSSGKRFWWRCPRCNLSWEASPNQMARHPVAVHCPSCRRLHRRQGRADGLGQ